MTALRLAPLLARLVFAQEVWNLIDVASVVCPGGPGATHISIKQFEIGSHTAVAATFFRASPQPLLVRFGITDASGNIVVEPMDVTLQGMPSVTPQPAGEFTPQPAGEFTPQPAGEFTPQPAGEFTPQPAGEFTPESWTRRLISGDTAQIAEADVSLCENFFLMDGRLPLDLPDTWGDARKAFREVCADVVVAEVGCSDVEQLMFSGSAEDRPFEVDGAFCRQLVERTSRLVGGRIGVGFLPVRRLKSSGYFESPSMVSSRFQPGYVATPYGYSGARVGAQPVHIFYYPLFFNAPYYSRYHTFPQDQGPCIDSECVRDFVPPDGFTRDDLPDTAFSIADYQLPLTVSFFHFDGPVLDPARICPPVPPGNWQPPPGSDIFFAFAAIDEQPVPWWTSCSYALMLLCCCWYCLASCKRSEGVVEQEDIALERLIPAPSASCPSGTLSSGDRVQTRWRPEEGGDGRCYTGVVHSTYEGNMVHIDYDDGTSWTGEASEVMKFI